MTREQDNKNIQQSIYCRRAVWQTSMTYWLNAYGEFLKNAPKMTEYWYDIYWKPWLNWMRSDNSKTKTEKDRIIINVIE